MKLDQVRDQLRQARERVEAGETGAAVEQIDWVLDELDPRRLLTTTQAAELLGVRSVNTVKLWCRNGSLQCVAIGSRTMVPLGEVERLQESAEVRAVRASDQLHDASAELGVLDGLDDEQLHDLAASRPGTLPWQEPRGASSGE